MRNETPSRTAGSSSDCEMCDCDLEESDRQGPARALDFGSPGIPVCGNASSWWVKLLHDHVGAQGLQSLQPSWRRPAVKLLSGCSGMMAEAKVLEARQSQTEVLFL